VCQGCTYQGCTHYPALPRDVTCLQYRAEWQSVGQTWAQCPSTSLVQGFVGLIGWLAFVRMLRLVASRTALDGPHRSTSQALPQLRATTRMSHSCWGPA
jgi:hypothetical protein